jgi:hypothetical protein
MGAIDDLYRKLGEAIVLLREIGEINDIYCPYQSGAEFASVIELLRDRIAERDKTAMEELSLIFAPTGRWDDGVGLAGIELANQISNLLEQVRRR